MNGCPDDETLSRWLCGRESTPDDPIGLHINECSECNERLAQFDSRLNVPAEKLRDANQADEFESEAELLRVANIVRNYGDKQYAQTPQSVRAASLGKFELLEEIGKGGMGRIYRARHSESGEILAIKVLSSSHTAGGEFLRRFQRETQLIRSLKHPHVVRAMDAGQDEGRYYIAMELITGVDLTQVAFHQSHVAIADACEIARQAAIGLQYTCDQGVTHRDIKPSNFMVDDKGTVKILDLGLAAITRDGGQHSITDSGQVMGSIDYMAPEQAIDSRHVDIRADIFGLGATLFQLLTGTRPFLFRRRKYLADPHSLSDVIPPAASERRSLPTGLGSVVTRMLAGKPADRFAQPKDCADALEPFCVGSNLSQLTGAVADAVASAAALASNRRGGDWPSKGIAGLLSVDAKDGSVVRAADCIEDLLASLSDSGLQQIARLHLEGFSTAAIAERSDCSPRTVKRRLELIGKVWKAKGSL